MATRVAVPGQQMVTMLSDPEPEFVSVVDKGANRKRWKAFKRDGEQVDPAEPIGGDEIAIPDDVRARLVGKLEQQRSVAGLLLKALGFGRKTVSADVQALVFDRTKFTPESASAWATAHGFQVAKVDADPDALVLVQRPSETCVPGSFTEKSLAKGVSAICAEVRKDEVVVVSVVGPVDFVAALTEQGIRDGLYSVMDAGCVLQCVLANIADAPDVADKLAAMDRAVGQFTTYVQNLLRQNATDLAALTGKSLERVPDAIRDCLRKQSTATPPPVAGAEEIDMTKEELQATLDAALAPVTARLDSVEKRLPAPAETPDAEAARIATEKAEADKQALAEKTEADKQAAIEAAARVESEKRLADTIATGVEAKLEPRLKSLDERIAQLEGTPQARRSAPEGDQPEQATKSIAQIMFGDFGKRRRDPNAA